MPRRRHLVIFVKEPRLGRVKTRLARDIGLVAATRFYRLATADLIRRLGYDARWRAWLAVAPDRAADARWWPAGLERRTQGPGDLGARMERMFHVLPPGPALIVGSDIPDIRPAHIARAFRALGTGDAVFGPAKDGGYWLVGVKRRRRRPSIFARVRWSSAHALADTLGNLKDARVALIETLDDIDDGRAYKEWRAL
jgi:rSAM/selenodomain-associated transferase 1